MERWIDTLSEEWPSQPPSERSEPLKQSPSAQDISGPTSNASQSRIPRYKHRSTSSLGPNDSVSLRRSSGPLYKNLKNVLSEKTSSNLNASLQRPANGASKLRSPNPDPKTQRNRHASTGSIPADTVQHKVSPFKPENRQNTPEWKRRVLKGNIGRGEQADLFGPIELENIFKPPNFNSKVLAKQRKGAKVQLASVEDYPSSPPPYPSAVIAAPAVRSGDEKRRQSTLLAQMELLEEDVEHSPKATVEDTGKRRKAQARTMIRTRSSVLNSRVPSNQSENRDEQLSEIYTRTNTVDGRFDYAAIDGSMRRLHSQMDKLRLQQQNLPSSRSSDDGISYAETRIQEDSLLLESRRSDLTSTSLPDSLATGAGVFTSNGGFVNVRRGGYSSDGSFQRRPLSPSSLPDIDDSKLKSPSTRRTSEDQGNRKSSRSRQNSIDEPRQGPRTPKRQDIGNGSSSEQPRSSGSPLKLFDKYDTFTNDRLVRRMSKFEETLQRSPTGASVAQDGNDAISPGRRSKDTKLSRHRQRRDVESFESYSKRRISSFGQGELDDHHFPTPQKPKINYGRASDASKENRPQQTAPRVGGFRFDQSEHPVSGHENVVVEKAFHSNDRRTPKRTTSGSKLTLTRYVQHPNDRDVNGSEQAHGLSEVDHNAQGKRLPYSPAKDPQPKRRRTLGRQEETNKEASFTNKATVPAEPFLKSTLGRKRKDALYDSSSQAADPRVLAMRQMLRPRTPTPGQVGSQGKTQVTKSDYTYESRIEIQSNQNPVMVRNGLQANLDSPPKALVNEIASFSLDLLQDTTTGARKASVTTANFVEEAKMIMQILRAQGRPQSQMSAQEPEPGQTTIQEEISLQDSTKDEFSRPPSREGGSYGKLREPLQLDARVISHLRKFEEKDEIGIALSSSLKTLQVDQSRNEPEASAPDDDVRVRSSDRESDPPNIRIINNESHAQNLKHSDSFAQDLVFGVEVKVPSYSSQSASNPSTGRSVPTGSSRGSGKRAVIAPETVSHLLSDHVAGMTFDHTKQVWVKRKTSKEDGGKAHSRAPSEITEDDPFGDVPDLSVDELEELARTNQKVTGATLLRAGSDQISQRDYAILVGSRGKVPNSIQDPPDSRPHTANSQILGPGEPSSAPSNVTRLTSSVAVAETRATSWGDDGLQHKQDQVNSTTERPATTESPDEHAEEVEHEISILEGRVSQSPKRLNGKQRQARVITVAFSSPLIDQMQPCNGGSEHWEEESELNLDDSPIHFEPQPDLSSRKRSTGFGRRSTHRSASRRVSIGSQSYIARPMSRLDEQDEISFLRGSDDARNMSIVVSTPLHRSTALQPPTTGQQSSIGFHLSPLPDFTVHQIDRSFSLDVDHVAKRRGLLAQDEVEGTFSLATQELVKRLTDIEPYEPYWDHIRNVDLQSRGLLTLHGLHEFCGHIEELDVSNNELGQLNGAPAGLRSLRIRQNCLSNLTAWGHLHNLQYLDVSGNQIQSLKGFYSLVHLRELRADDNEIDSLDGIFNLDGLISLRLRRNRVRSVDFEGSDL